MASSLVHATSVHLHACGHGSTQGLFTLPAPTLEPHRQAMQPCRAACVYRPTAQAGQDNHPGPIFSILSKEAKRICAFSSLNTFPCLLSIFSSHSLREKTFLEDSPSPWWIESPSFIFPSSFRLAK